MQFEQKSTNTPVTAPRDPRSPAFFAECGIQLGPYVARLFDGETSPELTAALRPLLYELEICSKQSLAAIRLLPKDASPGKERLAPVCALAHGEKLTGTLLTILEDIPSGEFAYVLVTKQRILEHWHDTAKRERIKLEVLEDIRQLPKLDAWLSDLGV